MMKHDNKCIDTNLKDMIPYHVREKIIINILNTLYEEAEEYKSFYMETTMYAEKQTQIHYQILKGMSTIALMSGIFNENEIKMINTTLSNKYNFIMPVEAEENI